MSGSIDPERLNQFLGKAIGDIAAIAHGPTVLIGESLGLYKALAGRDMTATELAKTTKTDPRLVLEWVRAQAAAGFVEYHPESETFGLSPEQAFALADENSPVYLPGALSLGVAGFADWPKVAAAFRSGKGLGWDKHNPALYSGTARFFRNGYAANIVPHWLPALEGVVTKLQAGASVADLGCGFGWSTMIMAQAFPKSRFVGFDLHGPSLVAARRQARKDGLSDRVAFKQATSHNFPGKGYDVITTFDSLHDMGDPLGAARRVRSKLAPNGTWMIVEPFAGDSVGANLNPVGRMFYSASTMICTPASLAQKGRRALGAQAPDSEYREIMSAAGFTRFRRALATPTNRIFEARP